MMAKLLLTVLVALSLADEPVHTNETSYNNLDAYHEVNPYQEYKSHPGLKSPIWQANKLDLDLVSLEPYLFLAAGFGDDTYSPYIFNATDLSLVYADPQYANVFEVRAQEVDGETFLTFWHGVTRAGGQADGYCVFFDSEYKLRYNITAKGEGITALAASQEVQVTKDGSVLLTVYNPITHDLTALGADKEGKLMDSMFQEVDPKTGDIAFTWSAADHFKPENAVVPYADSKFSVGGAGYDFFHINSVEKTKNGDYLVSSRHMSIITLISGKDGKPIWAAGGNNPAINEFSDLDNDTALDFAFQHHVRFLDDDETEITMFDNRMQGRGGINCQGRCSRGLHIKIDADAKTATLVKEYFHPGTNYSSGALGSYYTLDNSNVLVGWGLNPTITEFTDDGKVAMDVQVSAAGNNLSELPHLVYRAYKMDWEGNPTWDPKVAGERTEDSRKNVRLYASWNGATKVASWVVVRFPIRDWEGGRGGIYF